MLEEVLDVLAHLGEECVCYRSFNLGDVGKNFSCAEHGLKIVTKVEITGMNGAKLEYLVTLQDYA